MSEERSNGVQNDTIESDPEKDNCDEEISINEQNPIYPFDIYRDLLKLEKCVCKLKFLNNNVPFYATGFFCYIPSKDIRVFISNNHVIDQKFLDSEKELRLYYEDKGIEKEKIIDLNLCRAKYTNETLDITIIEIIDEDLIDDYFEVDEEFIKNKDFLGKPIINMQFPNGDRLKTSQGKIRSKHNINNFLCDARIGRGSSGSPIISIEESKIIGFHCGFLEKDSNNYDKNKNVGIYLDKIIEHVPKSSVPENKSIIKCLYNIEKEDLNNDVQIYNNDENIEKKITSVCFFKEEKRKISNGKCRFDKIGKFCGKQIITSLKMPKII